MYIYIYSIDLQYYTCTYATTVLLAPAAPAAPRARSAENRGRGRPGQVVLYVCIHMYIYEYDMTMH